MQNPRAWQVELRTSLLESEPVTPTGIVVQKYGGSSVADTDKIKLVAKRIARTKALGKKVVVVVSAMGKTTEPADREGQGGVAIRRRGASSTCC